MSSLTVPLDLSSVSIAKATINFFPKNAPVYWRRKKFNKIKITKNCHTQMLKNTTRVPLQYLTKMNPKIHSVRHWYQEEATWWLPPKPPISGPN